MKEEKIDDLIREQYASLTMSDSKIANILKNTPGMEVVVPFYRKTWFSYAAAACIAFMIVSVGLNQATRKLDAAVPTELASQVVNVYDRHLAPDVYSSDLRSIQTGLNHSDFSIIPTSMEPIQNYQITGGRNCGLKGLKAVHVVLKNKQSQKECCLYVLPDVEDFRRFKNALVDVGEGNVSFWHDNGRFFALYDPTGN